MALQCYILDHWSGIGSGFTAQWLKNRCPDAKSESVLRSTTCPVFVRPDSDILFNFLAAGFGVRLEVKVHNPGVEDEVHGREERFGERCAATANDLFGEVKKV